MKSHRFESVLFLIFLIGFTYRILLCFEVPVVSSDAYRSLGFASHAFDKGLSVYSTPAEHFSPEAWASHWGYLPYIYPPVALLFFYLFSVFHLGLVWVKLSLTLIDLLSCYFFYKHVSKLAAFLFFLSPAAMWYVSHEGQYETLQTLFIILTCVSVNKRKWFLAGVGLALSIQSKLWGFCLAPWVAFQLWEAQKTSSEKLLRLFFQIFLGIVVGILPFTLFYIQVPDLLFLSFKHQPYWYNPFAWNFFDMSRFGWNPHWLIIWNTIFTNFMVFVILGSMVFIRRLAHFFEVAPLLAFWGILKSIKMAQFWYVNAAPGFLFCLKENKGLVWLLMVLMFFQCGRSFSLLAGKQYGAWETQESMKKMEVCMLGCSFKP